MLQPVPAAGVATAALGAAFFDFFAFPGRAMLLRLLSLPLALPAIVVIIGIIEVYGARGWLGGLFDIYGLQGILLAHVFFNVPLAIWILEGFISAIPREMDESARIDGHGVVSFMRRILIPQIAPGIAVAAFFCFMFSWIEYMLANALTTVDAKPIAGIMTRAAGVMTGDIALLSSPPRPAS